MKYSSHHLMKYSAYIAAVSLTLALGVAAPASAIAPTAVENIASSKTDSSAATLPADTAKTLASNLATSASLDMSNQTKFDDVVSKIIEIEPDNFSWSSWSTESSTVPTVYFVNQPNKKSLRMIKNLKFKVNTSLDASLSMNDVDETLEKVMDEVVANESVDSATAIVDMPTSSIDVEYTSKPTKTGLQVAKTASIDQNLKVKVPSLKKAGLSVNLSKVSADESSSPTLTRGGAAFGGCTTGFAVTKGTQRGVLLAGHCGNSSYKPAGSSVYAKFASEHIGSYGDFQWHKTSDSISGSIRTNKSGTALESIKGQSIASVGSWVCRYGKNWTNQACGKVKSQSTCVKYSGLPKACRLVSVAGNFIKPGDSGGPWYYNHRAYGVTSGHNVSKNLMYYSRIGNAEAILGVNLKHS